MARLPFLALLLTLLPACGDDAAEGPAASGELIEGTISDEMLPLDQLASEPPLLEPELAPEAAGSEAGTGSTAGSEETQPSESEEEPAGDSEPAEGEEPA